MKQIPELYQKWLAMHPLLPEDEQRLQRKFMLDFNFNSNHIEGNTLTYGQTEVLLLLGEVVGSDERFGGDEGSQCLSEDDGGRGPERPSPDRTLHPQHASDNAP